MELVYHDAQSEFFSRSNFHGALLKHATRDSESAVLHVFLGLSYYFNDKTETSHLIIVYLLQLFDFAYDDFDSGTYPSPIPQAVG